MKKLLARIGIALLFVMASLLLILAVYGVPAPPGVSTKNLPRIPWKWTYQLLKTVRQANDTYSFLGWDATTQSMWIREGMQRQIVKLTAPGKDVHKIKGLPKNAVYAMFAHDPSYTYVPFSADSEGGELYDLYVYDSKDQSSQLLVPDVGRVFLGPISPKLDWFAYASTKENRSSFSVSLIDPSNPSSNHLISQGEGDFIPASFSSSGRSLILVNMLSFGTNRLFIYDIGSGQTKLLAPQLGDSTYIDNPRFASAEDVLYVISDYGSEHQQLMQLNIETGALYPLKGQDNWDVIQFEISDDYLDLVYLMNENGNNKLYQMDLGTEKIRSLPEPADGYITYFEFLPNSRKIALNTVSVSGKSGVVTYDLDTGTYSKWIIPDVAPGEGLQEVEAFDYPTFDSVYGGRRRVPAFLFPGKKTEESHPVIIDIHGGPAAQSGPYSMNPMYPLLREQGITIIAPNVRGSSGYGKSYHKLDDQFKREDAVRDIGALLDWIDKRKDLDANKVAVMGASYGGYMALASLVHYNNRLRCGCDLFGMSDLNAELNESSEHHFPEIQRKEYGDNRDPVVWTFLDSISPINQAEKISVPLLIFHGANDIRVKPEQSRRMVERLESLGRPVYYIEADNEGHGFRHPMNLLYMGAVGMHILKDCLLPN